MSDIIVPVIHKNLIDFLYKYDTFLIAGHKEPDGDCIGSALGLSFFLNRIGKKTVLLSAGPFKRPEVRSYEPLFLSRIPDDIQNKHTGTAVIIVDCSNKERTGDIAEQLEPFPCIYIDHHATNTETDPCSLVYPEAPSATFLIQTIIETMSGSVTREEAEVLFFGLCTDTGFFRHLDARSAVVFEHVARLVRVGVNPKKVFAAINGNKSFGSRILISRILDRMQSYYNGKLIISFETYEDTQEFGQEGRDSDILYQLIQSISGVEAICIVRQDTPTHCSVGFRSLDKVDVSIIAASFGGGGHKQASGLYIEGTINTLMPKFIEAFQTQCTAL